MSATIRVCTCAVTEFGVEFHGPLGALQGLLEAPDLHAHACNVEIGDAVVGDETEESFPMLYGFFELLEFRGLDRQFPEGGGVSLR
jgi:hypothetical protein